MCYGETKAQTELPILVFTFSMPSKAFSPCAGWSIKGRPHSAVGSYPVKGYGTWAAKVMLNTRDLF